MTLESYERVMNINLKGPVFFAQKIAKEMIWLKQQLSDYNPIIVFISSVSATHSSTNRAEYCVSKAGLSMAATIFADRLSGENIRVFEVRPGIIQTDMTAKVRINTTNSLQRDWFRKKDGVCRKISARLLHQLPAVTGIIRPYDIPYRRRYEYSEL